MSASVEDWAWPPLAGWGASRLWTWSVQLMWNSGILPSRNRADRLSSTRARF